MEHPKFEQHSEILNLYRTVLNLNSPITLGQLEEAIATAREDQLHELDNRLVALGIDGLLSAQQQGARQDVPCEAVEAITRGMDDQSEIDVTTETLAAGLEYSRQMQAMAAQHNPPIPSVHTSTGLNLAANCIDFVQGLLRNQLRPHADYFQELVGAASPMSSPARASSSTEIIHFELRDHDQVDIEWDDQARTIDVRPTRHDPTDLCLCAVNATGQIIDFLNGGKSVPTLRVSFRRETAHLVGGDKPMFLLFTVIDKGGR